MTLTIDSTSAVPPFEQLRVQLIEQVSSGALAAGARLPTVRKLAADLSLAPNTVARTYRELESEGIVETKGRKGTFVNTHGDVTQQRVQEAARQYAERVRQLGLGVEEGLQIVTSALRSS